MSSSCDATSLMEAFYAPNFVFPATFHQFGRLPRELRDLIWEFSVPGPRIVQLAFASSTSSQVRSSSMDSPHIELVNPRQSIENLEEPQRAGLHNIHGGESEVKLACAFGFKAINPSPGGLFACIESSLVYRKYFELSTFGTLGHDQEIWFNFQHDILFLDWEFGGLYRDARFDLGDLGQDINRIYRLAICDREPTQDYDPRVAPIEENDSELVANILAYFGPQVQELTLVTEHYTSTGPDLDRAPFCDVDTLSREYSLPYDPIRDRTIIQFNEGFDKAAEEMLNNDLFAFGAACALARIWWPLPYVERNVFACRQLVDEFNFAKKNYGEKKAAHNVSCFNEVCGPQYV